MLFTHPASQLLDDPENQIMLLTQSGFLFKPALNDPVSADLCGVYLHRFAQCHYQTLTHFYLVYVYTLSYFNISQTRVLKKWITQ